MSDLKCYEKKIIINSRDVDGFGRCKPSALLGYLQDASAEHTAYCGCGRRDMVEKYHVFWMLTRIRVVLDKPIHWLDELTIRTSHRVGRGILFYRDYELWVGEEQIGAACALWVLPDLETHKLLNASRDPIAELDETSGGLMPQISKLTALHTPDSLEFCENRKMRYSDSDVNGHVNNTRYADFAGDALNFEDRLRIQFWSLLEITYHEECKPGECIRIFTARENDDWFVHGADMDDQNRFDVRIQFQTENREVPYVK